MASSNRVGRDCIIQQAGQLFTERGYQAVSIREIADACGVTNAALYYHFKNKAALFEEVIQHHAQMLNNVIRDAASKETSLQGKITAMVQTYLSVVADQRPLMTLIRIKGGDEELLDMQENIEKMVQTVFAPFDEVIQEARAAGTIIEFPNNFSPAAVLIGMIHGIGGYKKICHQEEISTDDLDHIIGIFWRGISI